MSRRVRARPLDLGSVVIAAASSATSQQVVRFAAIGVVSTLAYVALYWLLRPVASAGVANAVALLLTAIGNTAANRRLTFDVRGRDNLARDHAAGLAALGVALAVTSASIAALQAIDPHAGRILELTVLIAANVFATGCRFVLLRFWIRRPPVALVPVENTPAVEASPTRVSDRIETL